MLQTVRDDGVTKKRSNVCAPDENKKKNRRIGHDVKPQWLHKGKMSEFRTKQKFTGLTERIAGMTLEFLRTRVPLLAR
jgi:hypothetical protein